MNKPHNLNKLPIPPLKSPNTTSTYPALRSFFMGIGFAVALVMIVYIGRTLAVIQADEEAAAEARAEEGEFQNVDDEEVGLMGAGLQVEAM